MTTTKLKLKIKSTVLISVLVVAILAVIISLSNLYLTGVVKWSNQNTNNTVTKKCVSNSQCRQVICPQVVGGNQPKCDLNTKACYCGGSCGDDYCDSVEKRDGTCPADCNKCSDNTLPGSCSVTKPLFCDNGNLIKKCNLCGCPTDQICQINGTCQVKMTTEAYFKFDYPPRPETFIFKLTDPVKIQQARDMLSSKTKMLQVMGKIIKEPAGYNPPWWFNLDPATINFFELAPEVCDAGIQYIQDHLQEACGSFLPDCLWCPWGSRLINEVKF